LASFYAEAHLPKCTVYFAYFCQQSKTTSIKGTGPVPGQHIILGIKPATVVNEFTPHRSFDGGTFEDGIIEDPPSPPNRRRTAAWIFNWRGPFGSVCGINIQLVL